MATGIVSLASHSAGLEAPAWLLFHINQLAYALLWILTLARILAHPPRVAADLADPHRGPGFLTLVAGTSVLGRQYTLLAQNEPVARALGVLAALLWAFILYGFLAVAILRLEKPELGRWINGTWLLAVVATQSVPLAWMGPGRPLLGPLETVVFLILALHLLGYVLYLMVITLIFLQFIGFRLNPAHLTAPYWINMGAMAITTLAGSVLLSLAPQSAVIQELSPFLKGLTVFAWSVATWWIPLLAVLFVWRRLVGQIGLVYNPEYWSMVFPLGMYSVCTFHLSRTFEIPFLEAVAQGFAYISLLAWLGGFVGLARKALEGLESKRGPC